MKAIEGIFMGYCTAFFCLYRKTMTTLLSGIRKREAKDSLAEQSTFSVFFFFFAQIYFNAILLIISVSHWKSSRVTECYPLPLSFHFIPVQS